MEDFIQSGLIAIADGDYDTAIDLLNKAISKDDKNYKAILLRAVAKSNKGDYPNAINGYLKLLARKSLHWYPPLLYFF